MASARERYLKISEMAHIAGLMASTIRYYTDMGLLKSARVTDGGHRLYLAGPTLERLNKIKQMVAKGMSLPEIRERIDEEVATKRILVVDDEQEVIDFIRDVLADAFPHRIESARDGFMAGRLIQTFEPDLVVLDLLLPGVDGFQVCKLIRSEEATKMIKVLAVTGYDSLDVRDKILASGADDFLGKPLEAGPTLNKICRLLSIKPVPGKT